jgi:hypothetical protein
MLLLERLRLLPPLFFWWKSSYLIPVVNIGFGFAQKIKREEKQRRNSAENIMHVFTMTVVMAKTAVFAMMSITAAYDKMF